MNKNFVLCGLMALALAGCQSSGSKVEPQREANGELRERTTFQSSGGWSRETDVRSDVVIVYGADDSKDETFEQRVNKWREKGYTTHFMSGIAWGGRYKPFFDGSYDGIQHWEAGQVNRHGDTLWHGKGHDTPYFVPTKELLEYLKKVHIKRVIDAGIDAIYMEEPEFWAKAGYSEAFKKEWKDYYGFDWRPQHESPENTYLSNKLKYQMYYNALKEVFEYAKEYGKTKGMNVRCYVPTHTLINYSQWMIVSPEASLASLPCVDGYIAQVWTGTSSEPNYFNGDLKIRIFETAFLEYGCMEAMTAPTGRKMYFLTDPIEDRHFDWPYYKKGYQATYVAELLYPNINNYEVMPWPDRIYKGLYQTKANSDEKERIPRFYSTQMQVMCNALNDMPLSDNKVSGSNGVHVLMANSMMFQRTPDPMQGYEDPQLANFYGEALPFIKRGVPVKTMHLENVQYPETWKDAKVLLMSYSNMKPLDPKAHQHLADWVKDEGGVIVYSGRDNDPYQSVYEWWNQNGYSYKCPSDHLFSLLGIGENPKEGAYGCGKGMVYVIRKDPKEFVMTKDADKDFVAIVKKMYEEHTTGGELILKNNFTLERGVFDLIAVVDENEDKTPHVAKGLFIDMFDHTLPIVTEKVTNPGEESFLLNIDRVAEKNKPQVLAAASRQYEEKATANSYSFVCKSPAETTNVMRVLLPAAPKSTVIKDPAGKVITDATVEWDEKSHTCLLGFENDPDGVSVSINW